MKNHSIYKLFKNGSSLKITFIYQCLRDYKKIKFWKKYFKNFLPDVSLKKFSQFGPSVGPAIIAEPGIYIYIS